MNEILPDRETTVKQGWTHQVQWTDDGKPCFVRCKSGAEADRQANRLRRAGAKPFVIDLRDALQLH
jgi:hypothetical protein